MLDREEKMLQRNSLGSTSSEVAIEAATGKVCKA